MADVKAYHRLWAEKEAELHALYPSGFLFLTTVERVDIQQRAGTVHEVSVKNAARCLTERTHTISTPEEIEGHQRSNAIVRESLLSAQNAGAAQRLRIDIKK